MSPADEPAEGPGPAPESRERKTTTDTMPQDWEGWSDLPLTGKARSRSPLFLGREMYRHRRIMDAARILPAFGTAMLLLPMLWAPNRGTATTAVYIFLVWLILIVAAGFLAHRLSEPLRRSKPQAPADDRER